MTHTEKKKVIERLVIVPKEQKRNFWAREIKSLNVLLETYPSDFFWQNLSFSSKVNSIIVFRSGYYKEEIIKKYRRFKFKVPPPKNIDIGEKTGEDYKKQDKPKNLREFLS